MNIKNIIFNTSAQVIGRVIGGLFSFLSLLLIAKALGGEYFGEYTKVTTVIAFFYIFCDFGLNTIFLRDHHKDWQEKFNIFWGTRLAISVVLMFAASLLVYSVSRFLPGFPTVVVYATIIYSISLIGQSSILSIQAVFQQTKRLDKLALVQVVSAVINFILILFFTKNISNDKYSGVLLVSLFLTLSTLLSTLVAIFLLKTNGDFKPKFDFHFIKNIWISSLPIGLTLIFNIIYFRADTFILSSTRSAVEVGVYGLAYKFFEVALILPTFIMNSIYPDLLKIKINSQEFSKKIQQILKLFLLMSILLVAVGWLLAPLLSLVKSDFVSSVPLFRILILGLPLFFLTSPLMWVLIILNKQWHLSYIYAISLVFNLICNLIFIPVNGGTAAAIITVVSEGLVLILESYFIIKFLWKKTF